MTQAMKNIVESYVRLGDRQALNDLKAHRAKLLMNMRIAASDFNQVSNVLEGEIATIDDGLARLAAKPS